jgi:hypothetical protein
MASSPVDGRNKGEDSAGDIREDSSRRRAGGRERLISAVTGANRISCANVSCECSTIRRAVGGVLDIVSHRVEYGLRARAVVTRNTHLFDGHERTSDDHFIEDRQESILVRLIVDYLNDDRKVSRQFNQARRVNHATGTKAGDAVGDR